MLLEQEAGIEMAQSALIVTQNTTFPTTINQLTSFTNIWQIVNTDIDQSIAFINAGISEDPAPLVCAHQLVVDTLLINKHTLAIDILGHRK